jgi:hypothetical protein
VGWEGTPLRRAARVELKVEGERQDTYFAGRIEFTCPSCGQNSARVPPGIWLNQRTKLQPSDLPTEMLKALKDALDWLPDNVTPEELKDRFPDAAPLILVAVERGGHNWLALLSIIVAVIIGYVAHTDSEDAIQVAQHAAEQQSKPTVALREREIEHVVSQALTKLLEQRERHKR